jgi:death-on-curing family protein
LHRTGGHDGVRDLNLIKSAIARPYTGYYRSVSQKAAALTESLARNHGFIDGNKRSALLTLYLFLRRSGYKLGVPRELSALLKLSAADTVVLANVEAEAMILSIVQNHLPYNELVRWFEERLRHKA